MTVDQPRRDEGAAQWHDLGGAGSGEFGAAADPDDAAAVNADRGILDQAQRVAGRGDHRQRMAVGKQAIPHGTGH